MKALEANTRNTHQDIIESCKLGKREAQHKLYTLYARAMYNSTLRIVGNDHDAEDVLQDSFLSVFQNIDQFKYQSSIGAWIKRIVINNSINFLNRRKPIVYELNEEIGKEAIVIEESNVVEIGKIYDGIKKLPDGFKQILILYLIEGFNHKEISEILSISEGTSKSQYHRAKNKLKEIIKSK